MSTCLLCQACCCCRPAAAAGLLQELTTTQQGLLLSARVLASHPVHSSGWAERSHPHPLLKRLTICCTQLPKCQRAACSYQTIQVTLTKAFRWQAHSALYPCPPTKATGADAACPRTVWVLRGPVCYSTLSGLAAWLPGGSPAAW
jgi:hypothetical protein